MQPGSQVMCWLYHAHHDARWFADPEVFRPERFLEPVHPKHAYLPFGAGTRMCIGKSFALMEAKLMLAALAQKFQLSLLPEHAVTPEPAVTLRPKNGILMRVSRRG